MRRMPEDRRLSRLVERGEDVEPRSAPSPTPSPPCTRSGHRTRATTGNASRPRGAPDGGPTGSTSCARCPSRRRPCRSSAETEALAGAVPRRSGTAVRAADRRRDGSATATATSRPMTSSCSTTVLGSSTASSSARSYRWGDVLSDVAFLAMDLERLGRPDLGQRFLAAPPRAERRPVAVDARAPLRRLPRPHPGEGRHRPERPAGRARRARRCTGTSTCRGPTSAMRRCRSSWSAARRVPGSRPWQRQLGDRLGAVVLRTDEVRQRVPVGDGHRPLRARSRDGHVPGDAARGPPARRPRGARDPRCHLELGRCTASSPGVPRQTPPATSIEIRCTLPRDEADARIRQRQAQGTDPSEATVEVAASSRRGSSPGRRRPSSPPVARPSRSPTGRGRWSARPWPAREP